MDDFVLRAVLAGLGVAAVAGPLGSFVVWRPRPISATRWRIRR